VIKLYKRTDDGQLAYHEAWLDRNAIIEHWGIVGTRGESRSHPMESRDEGQEIERILAPARKNGFQESDPENERALIIEYAVEGMGSPTDLKRRHRLEDHLNETLGWTGLGLCDGGSMGSGTMEVFCFVVDFDRAKAVIEESLKGTEFADYTRICDEDEDAETDDAN
jgi:hypothetical protein